MQTVNTVGDLNDAEYNPRYLSDQRGGALHKTLDEFGDLSPVVFNSRTGRLIGGHQRKKVYFDPSWTVDKTPEADEYGTTHLGYIITPKGKFNYREVDWPEKKEIAANLAANNGGGQNIFSEVLDLIEQLDDGEFDLELTGFPETELETMINYFPSEDDDQGVPDELFDDPEAAINEDEPGSEDMPLLNTGDVPDALFATDNDFDIPMLMLDLQADFIDLPLKQWGTINKKAKDRLMRGTWHFYTDDYKFNALWQAPYKLVNTKCPTAIEPNFSTGDQTPLALGLYQIYRKRWIARYWQQYGVRILVDLNVNEKFFEYNLMGVPQGWKAYATRGYADRIGFLDVLLKMARERAGTDNVLFLVYGGRKAIKKWCMENGATYVPEHMSIMGKDKADIGYHTIEGSSGFKEESPDLSATNESEGQEPK